MSFKMTVPRDSLLLFPPLYESSRSSMSRQGSMLTAFFSLSFFSLLNFNHSGK